MMLHEIRSERLWSPQSSASDLGNNHRRATETRAFKPPCFEQRHRSPIVQSREERNKSHRRMIIAKVDHLPLCALQLRTSPDGERCSALGSPFHTVGARGRGLLDGHAQARAVFAKAYRWSDDEIAEDAVGVSFTEGVRLFNAGDYYQCHDVLEMLWNNAADPQRLTLHGILQCAVGLYHLLHQNHRGAMVELGEGINKLRRVGRSSLPLQAFEQDISAVLQFVYNTQLEFAACSDDICVALDGSEQSYRLLGNFGAGQALYKLVEETGGFHIEFISQQTSAIELGLEPAPPLTVKIPFLQVSEDDLLRLSL